MGEDGSIQSSRCECARGELKCSHAAAMLIHAMWNLSSTDVECNWRKPATLKEEKDKPVNQIYPQREASYNPLAREVTEEDVEWFPASLRGAQCGMAWMLSAEPEPEPDSEQSSTIPTVPELLERHGLESVLASMHLSEEQQEQIQSLTIGQRCNPLWQLHRQGRLTASNFGAVLLSRSSTPSSSLIQRLLGGSRLDGVKTVNWGVVNEAEGVKAFEQAYQREVHQCGLFVSPSGILGASPDGLVEPSALLEVKCPYTQRNNTIAEAVQCSSFCLCEDGSGSYTLKAAHPYWHQVQGQLYLTKRDICFFVVWTTKEAIIVLIRKDPAWEENLVRLEKFYQEYILPAMARN